jgi:hypothetical protein
MSSRKSKTLLPKPEKGSMGKYSTKQSDRTRHMELKSRAKKKGYSTVMKELNLRSTLNKSNAPEAAKIMKSDMEYLRDHEFEIKSSKSGGRKSRQSKRSKSKRSRKSRRSRR